VPDAMFVCQTSGIFAKDGE